LIIASRNCCILREPVERNIDSVRNRNLEFIEIIEKVTSASPTP
jgi:hypothetical protein